MSLWGELRRRNVIKVAVAYLVASWLIVQVVGVLTDPLNLPDVLDTVVVVLLAIGFPFAVIVAWVYDVTPEGIKVTSADGGPRQTPSPSGKRLSYVVVGMLVVAVAFMAVDRFIPERSADGFGAGSRLAILPCDDLSPDPTDSFFAVGIHEELLNRLAALSALEVISRTSVQQYATRRPSIPQIASELNADAIMECSARYAGDRVLLTAQLIDGSSDTHLWSQSYPADMSDLRSLFEVQAELAMDVANALHLTFFDVELERIERISTDSREAYELYLEGLALDGNTRFRQIIDLMNQAIELDAQFAEAWSVRSTAFSALYNASALEDDRRAAIAEAMQSAQRAIELAPNQGHGYRARGVARINRREWLGAEDDFRVGIGRGDSPLPYARFLMSVGHLDSARTAYERVFETDPRNGRARADLPLVNEMLGDPEAADTAFEQGRQFFPGGWIGDVQWGLVRLGRGEVGPGYDPIRNVGPGFQEVWQLKEDGDTAGAVALIRRLATETPRPAAFLANYSAWAAYVGDADYALQLLDRAVAETGGGVWMYMAWLPVFADVRQLGEFHDLVRQIGLVDYWQTRSWPEMCSPLGDGDFVCS